MAPVPNNRQRGWGSQSDGFPGPRDSAGSSSGSGAPSIRRSSQCQWAVAVGKVHRHDCDDDARYRVPSLTASGMLHHEADLAFALVCAACVCELDVSKWSVSCHTWNVSGVEFVKRVRHYSPIQICPYRDRPQFIAAWSDRFVRWEEAPGAPKWSACRLTSSQLNSSFQIPINR